MVEVPVLKGHVKSFVKKKAVEARSLPRAVEKLGEEPTSHINKEKRNTLLGLRMLGAPRVRP